MKETIISYTKLIVQLLIIIVLVRYLGLFWALILILLFTSLWVLYNWKKYKHTVESVREMIFGELKNGNTKQNNNRKTNNRKPRSH